MGLFHRLREVDGVGQPVVQQADDVLAGIFAEIGHE